MLLAIRRASSSASISPVRAFGQSRNKLSVDEVLRLVLDLCEVIKDVAMSKAKQGSKRKHPARKALPMLGAAGLTLSLAGGASALPAGPITDIPRIDPNDLTLGEEEIADVSLATFYVFDKENVGTSESDVQLVHHGCHGCHGCGGCHGCRGCGGCRHGCGCHGCGGCGGCGCWWWGGCGIWWGGCVGIGLRWGY